MADALPRRSATRRVYDGKVVRVDVDTVHLPNGRTADLEMIRHPGASAVLPFLSDPTSDDPQIILVRQYRHAANGYIWEVPAGKLDAGEAPESCARRELREETGCSAGRLERLTTFYTTPGFTDERIHAFMAWDLTRGATEHQHDEVMTVETLHLSRALDMIAREEITDGKTALTILFAAGIRLGR